MLRMIAVLVAVCEWNLCALAQWTTDPTINTFVGTGYGPTVIADGTGGLIVGWRVTSVALGESLTRLLVQRISSGGVARWHSGGVPVCPTSDSQYNQRIVSDGQGGVILAWMDRRAQGISHIYAQRINEHGVALWKQDGVSICMANGYQQFPQLTGDGTGGAFITWEDYRDFAISAHIYCQYIDADGFVRWAEDGIPLSSGDDQYQCQITTDMAGGAIVVWQQKMGANDYDIVAQRVTTDGQLLWGSQGTDICPMATGQYRPEIKSDGWCGAVVTWEDERNGLSDIFVQRIDSSGNVLWALDGVPLCTAKGSQQSPVAVSDELGGAIVCWDDGRASSFVGDGKWDIYAQRVSAHGEIQWPADGQVISGAPSYQQHVQMCRDGSGGAVMVWDDQRAGVLSDVYAQRINAAGVLQWLEDGAPVSTARGSQEFPVILGDEAGGAFVAWQETARLGPAVQIYAQHLNARGGLTTVRPSRQEIPEDVVLMQNYPNPFNSKTRMTFRLARTAYITLRVCDLLGRHVTTLLAQQCPPGTHSAVWNATHVAAGVYQFRLQAGDLVLTRRLILLK